MIKHTIAIHSRPTNILNLFHNFVGFLLKGLILEVKPEGDPSVSMCFIFLKVRTSFNTPVSETFTFLFLKIPHL